MADEHVVAGEKPRDKCSQIFAPFRAVGFVSSHVPLDLQSRGPENYVTTVIGNSFHIYDCSRLNLVFVGEPLDEPIQFIFSLKRFRLAAAGDKIAIFKRGKKIQEYTEHKSPIVLALTLADHVISVDGSNVVKVWDVQDLETYLTLELDKSTFQISAAVHPSTYLNKILFGSYQGSLQLWNIKTNSKIHEFQGWEEPITVLEQAPAVDVIAIGLQSGKIILHNMKFDESLMKFHQDFGPVINISFRTDGSPIMATGSTAGHISLWDLEKRKVSSVMWNAHTGSVAGMKFLQKQPLLITSGPDNSLKVWIFDSPDGSGRLLKSRGGHSGPPTKLMFYGELGHVILSSGLDRAFRYTFTIRDEQSCEMSQGSLVKKSKATGVTVDELRLPPITCMAAEPARDNDWDNIVTCHYNCSYAQTWRLQRKAIGKHKLGGEKKVDKHIAATVVDVSSCGNFAVIGYSNGRISLFNLQSGIHRGNYTVKDARAHKETIRGVAIDNANLSVITASADCSIKFWSFKDKVLQGEMKFEYPIHITKLHRESSLLAVALDDFSVHIVDIDTKKVVRQFPGHSSVITSICFSNDARWLLTSSMDATIKVWDIPAARLIDCFCVETPATSVALSPTSEFLATTHIDDLGIYLWSNSVLYTGVYPSPLPNDYEPKLMQLPNTQIECSQEEELKEIKELDDDNEDNTDGGYKSPEQLSGELITLSLLPESRWRSLINLELIKERNKPKQPPTKPKAAPFFLPTTGGLEPKFDLSKTNEDEIEENSKVMQSSLFTMDSEFKSLLRKASKSQNYSNALEKLKSLSPAQTDVEFRTLSPDAGGDLTLMQITFDFFVVSIETGKDFELIQAYVALFLKLHGNLVTSTPELREASEKLLNTLDASWRKCEDMINQSLCLVNYFKSATI